MTQPAPDDAVLWYEFFANIRGPISLLLPHTPPRCPFTIECSTTEKSESYWGADEFEAAAKATEFFHGFGDIDGVVRVRFWAHLGTNAEKPPTTAR